MGASLDDGGDPDLDMIRERRRATRRSWSAPWSARCVLRVPEVLGERLKLLCFYTPTWTMATAATGCASERESTQERIRTQRVSHELAAEVRGHDEEDDEDGEELGTRVDDDLFATILHLADIDREPLSQGV